jgi:hypothetical protein
MAARAFDVADRKALAEPHSLCKASALCGNVTPCEGKAIKHCCARHKAAIIEIDDRARLRLYRGEHPAVAFNYHKSDKKGGGCVFRERRQTRREHRVRRGWLTCHAPSHAQPLLPRWPVQ